MKDVLSISTKKKSHFMRFFLLYIYTIRSIRI